MPRTSAAAAGADAKAPKPRSTATRTTRRKKADILRAGKEEVSLTGDRIVVEHPDQGERRSSGGLLIPATAVPAPKRCMWAEVALVGPDVRVAKAGDRILFLPQAGLEVELSGKEYLLLRERDVQAVATSPDGKERVPGQYL